MNYCNLQLEIENAIDSKDIQKTKYIENKYPLVFINYVDGLIGAQNTLAKRISFIENYNKLEK